MAYQLNKTLEKFLWTAGEVIVAGLLVVLTERNEFIALVPFLEALRNYLKHRND